MFDPPLSSTQPVSSIVCRPVDRRPGWATVTSAARERHMVERVSSLFTALLTGLRRIVSSYGPEWAHVAWTYNPMWLSPEGNPGGPARGHPEKLASHIPMSQVERGLWAQLDSSVRR
jgi:hypothetical protein